MHKDLLTGNNKAAIEQKNCKVSIEMSKTSDSNLKFLDNVFYPKEAELYYNTIVRNWEKFYRDASKCSQFNER